jgi:hypothetical protein
MWALPIEQYNPLLSYRILGYPYVSILRSYVRDIAPSSLFTFHITSMARLAIAALRVRLARLKLLPPDIHAIVASLA